jgi:hypothetical protein
MQRRTGSTMTWNQATSLAPTTRAAAAGVSVAACKRRRHMWMDVCARCECGCGGNITGKRRHALRSAARHHGLAVWLGWTDWTATRCGTAEARALRTSRVTRGASKHDSGCRHCWWSCPGPHGIKIDTLPTAACKMARAGMRTTAGTGQRVIHKDKYKYYNTS